MKTQRGEISIFKYGFAVYFHPKGMSRIIDDLQTILVGYLLYADNIAWLTIAVNRHDGSSPRRDGRLYTVRIHATVRGVDIDKDGLDAIPPYTMGRCDKTIGGRYHLSTYTQCLQCR